MTDRFVVPFGDENSGEIAVVGGKGASLGRLTRAGFPVPSGFTVTTHAYRAFLEANGLDTVLKNAVADLAHGDPEKLEAATALLRARIDQATVPDEVAEAITHAYRRLGENMRVAVRSSGTAEDLADASFAGQHDTYLDRCGEGDVLGAVRRCWASLWTARATAYRQAKGFDHLEVGMAVVVQSMIDAEVSGVLFTGNPMNAANDEMVVNSSWGLGEAVVSGLVEPDELVVRSRDYAVLQQHCGTKTVKIVRDPASGVGTVKVDVPPAEADQPSLTDLQVRTLCELGRRVTEYFDSIPQDLEFGFVGDQVHLLQSRPITGVNFSWDCDLEQEHWQRHPESPHTLWTRLPADEYMTGAVTPLFYSMRCDTMSRADWTSIDLWGVADAKGIPLWKYYKAVPYNNTHTWAVIAKDLFPSAMRPLMLQNVDPRCHAEVLAAPKRPLNVAKVLARVELLERDRGITRWHATWEDFRTGRRGAPAGRLSAEDLRQAPDSELLRYLDECVDIEAAYIVELWPISFYVFPLALGSLAYMVQQWYQGSHQSLFVDLITGTEVPTETALENQMLWELAQGIRKSAALQGLFHDNPGRAFLTAFEDSEEGRDWLAHYREFATKNYHRGHQDRDIYYTRRFEDWSIDYPALQALLASEGGRDPRDGEHTANSRRNAAFAEMLAGISTGVLGQVKVEAFKILHRFLMKFLAYRDDQRYWADHIMAAAKRCVLEINRRMVDRGVLADRDVFFLGREELQETMRGSANMTLARAKIAGRRQNFEDVLQKTAQRPMYLDGYTPIDLTGPEDDDGSGVLRGMPTSNGEATGTARIVKSLSEIGRIRSGDVLVCNSTDPSWSTAFLLISGIVVETGGMLAHASCLAREYGLPAVQLRSAMQRIPDEARITVNGSTGTVTVET